MNLSPSNMPYHSYLVAAPFTLSSESPNNIYMESMAKADRVINHPKALRQFVDLYNFLSNFALTYILPTDNPNLPDAIFTSDIGLIPPHLNKNIMILSNTDMPSRKGELPVGKEFFELLGYKVIQCPFHWQGQSELKPLKKNVYIGGSGVRTSPKAFDWFEKEFNMKIIRIIQDKEEYFHLDAYLFPLTSEKVITCPEVCRPQDIKELEKYVEIIPVDAELLDRDITGCLRTKKMILTGSNIEDLKYTDKDFLVERRKIDTLEKICHENSLELVTVNLSEAAKRAGSLACCVFPMSYPDFGYQDG